MPVDGLRSGTRTCLCLRTLFKIFKPHSSQCAVATTVTSTSRHGVEVLNWLMYLPGDAQGFLGQMLTLAHPFEVNRLIQMTFDAIINLLHTLSQVILLRSLS